MNKIISSVEDLKSLAARIKEQTDPITLDTETNGLFFAQDSIIGFSMAFSENEGYYVPVKHKSGLNIPERLVRQLFQLLSQKKLIFHNAKFDIQMIAANYGIKLPVYADTMAMAYLLCTPKMGLKDLISDFYGYETVEFNQLLSNKYGKNWKRQGFTAEDLSAEDIAEYAINDVLYTYKLFNRFVPEIQQFKSIYKIEMNLIPIVAQMNMEGILIDKASLEGMASIAKAEVNDLYSAMKDIAKFELKPNSPRDIAKILYEDLGLPVLKRSRQTGAPSSDADVLEELAKMHDFPKYLQQFRSLNKFISGYLEKIPNILDANNLMFANLTSLGAESGRFTCPSTSNHLGEDMTVNLQNQPVSDKFDVRSAFIAPEGWSFVKFDYSQIEYRMMMNLSGQQSAIEKFNQGFDFHTITARMMLGIPDDVELTRDQRQLGKVLNFGISYGMTVETIARMTNHSVDEAQQLYDKYFESLPKLKAFIIWAQNEVREKKAVKTLFGRMRKLDWTGLPPRVRDDIIKKGFNTIIQGSCADILKIAMLRVKDMVLDKWGSENVRLMITVHDELDFYVRNEVLFEVMKDIKYAMEIPTPPDWCKFTADGEYGPNWSEASHTDWVPSPEEYQPQPWTGWKDILPDRYKIHLEDENYTCQW